MYFVSSNAGRTLYQFAILSMLFWGTNSTSIASDTAVSTSNVFNLKTLTEFALRENQNLKLVRYGIETGRARLVQAGLLPNPRLDVATRSDFAFSNAGEYNVSLTVSQQFPVAGRILRQKEVAQADIALAEAEVIEAERQLAGEIASTTYQLKVNELQIQSRDAFIKLEQSSANIAKQRLKSAEISELDVSTLQLDVDRLSQEKLTLSNRQQSLRQTLNGLLSRPINATLIVDVSVPENAIVPALETVQAKALNRRPDLRVANLHLDRAHAAKALAQAQRWEDWSLGLGLEQSKQVIEGAPPQGISHSIGVNVSIPLPLFSKNQGQIAEANVAVQEADLTVETVRRRILNEITANHTEASNLQQQLARYRDSLLPTSKRNLELAQRGYQQGQLTLLEIIQAQRQQAELNANYLTTLDQFLQSMVRLTLASGEDNFNYDAVSSN